MSRCITRAIDLFHLVTKYGCDTYLPSIKTRLLHLLLVSHMRDPWPIFLLAYKQGWGDIVEQVAYKWQKLGKTAQQETADIDGKVVGDEASFCPWELSDEQVEQLGPTVFWRTREHLVLLLKWTRKGCQALQAGWCRSSSAARWAFREGVEHHTIELMVCHGTIISERSLQHRSTT